MANGRQHVMSGARRQKRPAPICAISDNIEVCVHETIVRKYGPGPLEQARKLLDKTDLRAAAGLAVATLAFWKFIQRRRRTHDDRRSENEERVSEATKGETRKEWKRSGEGKPPTDDENVAAEGVHELVETRRALELDLEESAAERRAAEEGLRQGFERQLLVEERGVPYSSAETPPLEATSPRAEDSPVAALLAKAKATSEKVDRIHERLRRLSKGDAPK
ncbi:hypothetical protein KFL_001020150 [Klebsormidium nitens]|uniref:Uncharacterized protein n=1 Tax=Klebsormidium nitens TaxID=105231 RepID=A0A1Y1HU58_KLENI|nr:hypothetical protein KFL_001020150 [Klebsormidium nitens]|eukprot:GAQ82165.1 hypothetical protein KFL_001020150 [Klebsormidium nitens]